MKKLGYKVVDIYQFWICEYVGKRKWERVSSNNAFQNVNSGYYWVNVLHIIFSIFSVLSNFSTRKVYF